MIFSDINLFYAGVEKVDSLRGVHEWRHADPGVYSKVTAMGGLSPEGKLYRIYISSRGSGKDPRKATWEGNIETWQEFNQILDFLESMTRTFPSRP